MIRLEITDPETGLIYVPHLPADFSLEMQRENPLFTRRGDYTYDINISLLDPLNRSIYRHLDRLTSTTRPENRKAKLICDGHVICDGTEVVLKKESNYVKIQILAENSEMNYLVGGDFKIRDMNFGNMTNGPSTTDAEKDGSAVYPDMKHGVMMVRDTNAKDNEYPYYGDVNFSFKQDHGSYDPAVRTRSVACPYLLYYVEKIVELLGYTLRRNELMDVPAWRRLCIIGGPSGGRQTAASYLPNWTVAEFLEQIELFFGCIFSRQGKYVDILKVSTFYTENAVVAIDADDVEDLFDREYESTDEIRVGNENIAYDLPSDEFGATADLSEDVYGLCTKSERLMTSTYQDFSAWKVYTDSVKGIEYIYLSMQKGTDSHYEKAFLINQFAKHISDPNAQANTLKIIPAEVQLEIGTMYRRSGSSLTSIGKGGILIPVTAFAETENEKTLESFADAVKSKKEKESGSDTMRVAFQSPAITIYGEADSDGNSGAATTVKAPMAITTDKYVYTDPDSGKKTFLQLTSSDISNIEAMNLSFYANNGRSSANAEGKYIDVTKAHTIRFRGQRLDPMKLYRIHDKLWACSSLKYTYSNGRQDPYIEGTFFPYK